FPVPRSSGAPMTCAQIEGELKQAMGLDAASIGSRSIELAAQARMSACKLESTDAYLALLRRSSAELQALIEAVVVPETWFFRDREAFTALARIVADESPPARAGSTFHLLSLPCS